MRAQVLLCAVLTGGLLAGGLYTPDFGGDPIQSPLGTLEPLLELSRWLIDAARELLAVFESALEMLGLENETGVRDLREAMETSFSLATTPDGQA